MSEMGVFLFYWWRKYSRKICLNGLCVRVFVVYYRVSQLCHATCCGYPVSFTSCDGGIYEKPY